MPRGILAAVGPEAADQPPAVPRCEACRRRRGIPSPVLDTATIDGVGQTWLCKNATECRRFW